MNARPNELQTPAAGAPARRLPSRALLLGGLALGGLLLLLMLAVSILFGAADIAARDVWAALFAFDGDSMDHLVIRTLRVPRALAAALVGAALAVAGGVMQGLTRNPLADAGILGINSGAALALVSATVLLGIGSPSLYPLVAFGGAALTGVAVYLIGSSRRSGPTPLTLTLAGAALTALFSSFTTGLLIMNQRAFEEVRFWLAGSLAGRDLTLLLQIGPWLLAGLVLALSLGRQITALALGEDVAAGLGINTLRVKALAALAVTLLAGGSVALAGPIGFVGLVAPHVVRAVVSVDYRWILPYSALAGALFLPAADLLARLVLRPTELPLGVMTALVGGPLFIWLVRARLRRSLR